MRAKSRTNSWLVRREAKHTQAVWCMQEVVPAARWCLRRAVSRVALTSMCLVKGRGPNLIIFYFYAKQYFSNIIKYFIVQNN